MLGDVGIESLPALAELEELKLGATRIQRHQLQLPQAPSETEEIELLWNSAAQWRRLLVAFDHDLDLDTIAMLSDLEELSLGVGLSLAESGVPTGGGNNCRLAGGIKITDLGLAKLAKLKKLRLLDVSGAQITPSGLKVLQGLATASSALNLWNCKALDDSARPSLRPSRA